MDHNKDSTAASVPADAMATTANNNTTTAPAVDSVPEVTAGAQPPRYEEHNKEVTPAPGPVVTSTTMTSPPLEKTAWQSATQTPAPQPGQPGQIPVAQRAIDVAQLGEEPRLVNCPFCYQQSMTRVQKESTSATGMAAVGCCLFGGIICAFLPYCMEMCHDSHHFCTLCGAKVAIRQHDGEIQVFMPQQPVVAAPGQVQPPQAVAMTQDTITKTG